MVLFGSPKIDHRIRVVGLLQLDHQIMRIIQLYPTVGDIGCATLIIEPSIIFMSIKQASFFYCKIQIFAITIENKDLIIL